MTTARLEKVYSLNTDQRQLRPTSHRQSSFDVATYRQQLTPTNDLSSSLYSQEVYYTPRGSNLSVAQTSGVHPMNSSASLDPNYIYHQIPNSRKNSSITSTPTESTNIEKSDWAVTYDVNSNQTTMRPVTLEKQKSSEIIPQNESDKQSLSFDTVHLLRPGNRPDVTRRAKSYDHDDQRRATSTQTPIVIKIPDIEKLTYEFVEQNTSNREEKNRNKLILDQQPPRRSFNIPHTNGGRKATLIDTRFVPLKLTDGSLPVDDTIQAQDARDLWALRKSYEIEETLDNTTMTIVNKQEQQQNQREQDITSPEELSTDFLTSISTSFDSNPEHPSAITHHYDHHHQPPYLRSHTMDSNSNRLLPTPDQLPSYINNAATNSGDIINNEMYKPRRKSSSNLLLPPPEVRRQALRRTFEKRRSYISQSNALLRNNEQQKQSVTAENFTTMTDLIERQLQSKNSTNVSNFNNTNNNYNSKSENSSFERSLETDFDLQSDTSSRPGDQFTSIESSGNEYTDTNTSGIQRAPTYSIQRKEPLPPSLLEQHQHHDDSGYKSLESQTSQNRTTSLDWLSVDGAESVIYLDNNHDEQHRSIDSQNIEEVTNESLPQEKSYHIRRSPVPNSMLKYGQSSYECQQKLTPPVIQCRSLSTNIPIATDLYRISSSSMTTPATVFNNVQIENSSNVVSSPFNRTASKKRREFGKDKKDALIDEQRQQLQINEQHQRTSSWNCQQSDDNLNSSPIVQKSSLQVKYEYLRRTKSDDSRNIYTEKEHTGDENNNHLQKLNNSNNLVTLSAEHILNTSDSHHRLPFIVSDESSIDKNNHEIIPHHYKNTTSNSTNQTSNEINLPTTQSQSLSPFRSKRGSFSFDASSQQQFKQQHLHSTSVDISSTPTSQIDKKPAEHFNTQIPNTNIKKHSPISVGYLTKPRFKFSIVRDSNMPVYSMPLFRDYSIDEKTNRIVNEFLKYDPLLDSRKHHPSQTYRTKTVDESNNNYLRGQQDNNRRNFKRHHSSIVGPTSSTMMINNDPRYINLTKKTTSLNLSDSIEEEPQQPHYQRYTTKTNVTAPPINIIITGDDSGS
ncbi:unnamed protein product [Didymodactylos carnosus]|nr:unnamed protein product [Didymodactylos carnosus]CAF4015494.1 unnamed protein product [Didymodactylos carnosus]